jgi:hypothetical protein
VFAEDDGRVRLVRAEIPFRTDAVGRQVLERARRSTDEHCGRRHGRVLLARERRDRPTLGDRDREGPPRTLTGSGFPKRLAGQGKAVRLPAPVVQRELDERQDVRRRGIEDERVVERGGPDRAALRPEPAGIADGVEVQRLDGGLDDAAGRGGDLRSPY